MLEPSQSFPSKVIFIKKKQTTDSFSEKPSKIQNQFCIILLTRKVFQTGCPEMDKNQKDQTLDWTQQSKMSDS